MTHSTIVYIALGSNLGDRRDNLETAIERMAAFTTLMDRSRIYETPPMYVADQPDFLNMAVRGATKLEPEDLLNHLKHLEQQMGRNNTVRNGPRLIDMDILYYGNKVLKTKQLTLPHPRIAERSFVLHPLHDLTPDWRDPRTGKTVAEMLVAQEKRENL